MQTLAHGCKLFITIPSNFQQLASQYATDNNTSDHDAPPAIRGSFASIGLVPRHNVSKRIALSRSVVPTPLGTRDLARMVNAFELCF